MTIPDASGPRILAYSHDSIGLGHMRRNTNIVSRVLARMESASALMVIGSPAGFMFDMVPGMDFLKLPSIVKYGRDDWRADRLRVSDARILDLRAAILAETARFYEPDLVLVDHMPVGVSRELVPMLEVCQAAPHRPHMVLGLRDILDLPERTRASWARNQTEEAISAFYDEVLIYGDAAIYDSASNYGLHALKPGAVHDCGYVTADVDADRGAALRRDRGVPPDQPLVVLSGGGGRDAFPLMTAALAALESMPAAQRPAVAIVSGPLMAAEERAVLAARSAAIGAEFMASTNSFTDVLAAADAFVGMGGYNSVTEAMNLGVPTTLVPREGPTAEQSLRATMLAERGAVTAIPLAEATPDRLRAVLTGVTRLRARAPAPIPLNGAEVAAGRLLAALAARQG